MYEPLRFLRKTSPPFSLVAFLSLALLGASNPAAKAPPNSPDSVSDNFSRSVLTAHYGILTKDDTPSEAGDYKVPAFKAGSQSGASYWRCFPTKAVSPRYSTWRDADSMGPANVIVTLCTFSIDVRAGSEWNSYVDRRGHPVSFCRDLVRNWKRITRGQSHVCLEGEPSGIDEKVVKGTKHRVLEWTWNKVKSKRGCYSYFEGDCSANRRGR